MFDRYASIIFIALGIVLFFYSRTLTTSSTGGYIGPKELPLFLSVVLIITGVINLFLAIRSKSSEIKGNAKGLEYKKFFILVGILLLYVVLLEPVGYVITTFLFLMGAFQTMEKGGYLKSAIIAAAFAGGVYYFYVYVALGSLPGMPFFD
jgi:putative tricarboxylic transport membrane protein